MAQPALAKTAKQPNLITKLIQTSNVAGTIDYLASNSLNSIDQNTRLSLFDMLSKQPFSNAIQSALVALVDTLPLQMLEPRFARLLRFHVQSGDLNASLAFLDKLHLNGYAPGPHSLNMLLKLFAQYGMFDAARSLFDRHQNAVNVDSFVLLVKAAQNSSDCFDVLQQASLRFGIQRPVLLVALSTFARLGNLEAMNSVFQMCVNNKFKINLEFLLPLLSGYTKANDQPNVQKTWAEISRFDIPIQAYNIMLNYYAVQGKIDALEQLFSLLAPKADTGSYNIAIKAYVLKGDLFKAHEVFLTVPNPNAITFTTLISGYGRSMPDKSISLFNQMKSTIIPTRKSFVTIMDICAEQKMYSQLIDLFNDGLKRGVLQMDDCNRYNMIPDIRSELLKLCSRHGTDVGADSNS